jgi:hypothetical protein
MVSAAVASKQQRGKRFMGDLLGIEDFQVCDLMVTDNAAGAQTERRGEAGPGRVLLGGETSPAAYLLA